MPGFVYLMDNPCRDLAAPQKSHIPQPLVESRDPTRHRAGIGRPDTETMGRIGIYMKLSGYPGLFVFEIYLRNAFRDILPVFVPTHQEQRRSVFYRFETRTPARIDQRLEIRSRALSVYRI